MSVSSDMRGGMIRTESGKRRQIIAGVPTLLRSRLVVNIQQLTPYLSWSPENNSHALVPLTSKVASSVAGLVTFIPIQMLCQRTGTLLTKNLN